MRTEDCRLREFKLKSGYHAVSLENQFVSITLLPEKGADICSLVYKPKKMDVLWKAPWGMKKIGTGMATAGSNTEVVWMDHYEGGWQEIFPNGGNACVYRGAPLNFHGEASTLPWDYTVVRKSSSRITVEFLVRLYRSPFLLRRSLTIEKNLPAVIFDATLLNEAEEEMHFMWGQHPALGQPFLSGDCRIHARARTFCTYKAENTPPSRIPGGTSSAWPMAIGKDGQSVDLSVVPGPEVRVSEMGYLCDLEEGWYGITNQKLGFGFGLAWPKEVFRYLWFWQELRGSFGYPWYGRCYVMAVEPFTSIPGTGLAEAVAAGTAPVLGAGEKLQANLAAVFYEGSGEVENISVDGSVQIRSTHSG
jgi:hypothetical protein